MLDALTMWLATLIVNASEWIEAKIKERKAPKPQPVMTEAPRYETPAEKSRRLWGDTQGHMNALAQHHAIKTSAAYMQQQLLNSYAQHNSHLAKEAWHAAFNRPPNGGHFDDGWATVPLDDNPPR